MEKDYSNLHRKLVFKYFWQVARHYKVSFFTIMFFTVLTHLLDIFIPLQYLKLWDLLSKNNFSLLGNARHLIIFIFLLYFFRWVFRRTSGFFYVHFLANSMANLRKQSFSYMIGHSHTFFANKFSGSLTQKVNKYVRAFEKLADRLVMDALPLLIRGVGIIIAIYSLTPKYSIILGIFSLVFVLTSYFYIRFKLKYDIIASEKDSKTVGVLADSITNHSSIQIFTGEDHERERVGRVIDDQKKATAINWYWWEGLGAVQSFYSISIVFVVFYLALSDWYLGILSVPVMILLYSYLSKLTEDLWSFGGIVKAFYESFADAFEMVEILKQPYEILDNPKTELTKIKGEITFSNVTHIYNNEGNKIFDNFSLTIKPGEKIALVGSSGAGKTTFVRLLMRMFDLTSGFISIDGVNIKDISQRNLRENIAFVPQDPVLFHRTLKDNIKYGKRDAKDEDVLKAASLAHCDDFIDGLPKGYETYVGERGIKLSGGERQRVAIARAILKNAPILILDEATSSLDSHSEFLIQDALRNLILGKTTIIIAHRLSTIKEMDRIIVIEEGKIVEEGKHEELLERKGSLYKKLWDLQAGGFKNLI